jgi:hypothetical protein
MTLKNWTVWIGCLAALILISTEALAYEGKIKLGKISVIPGLALQEEYNDNIYLGSGDNDTTQLKEDDWITHIKPSLVFTYDMLNRGAISLGYLGDFAMYSSNSDNDWSSHQIVFKGDYKAPVGLIVGINNNYVNSDDPYSTDNLYRLGEQTKRWSDDLATKVGYEFGEKFRILAFYNMYKQEYDLLRDYSQNYDSNEVGAGAEMKVMPQTWAFVRVYTGERDYTDHPSFVPNFSDANDADFSWNRVNFGLGWDATAKLSGELNLGYQWISADNVLDPVGQPYEDNDSWIAQTKVNYQATARTKFGAELFRALRYTGADLNEFYEETGFGLNLNQDVLSKGRVRAGAGYALHDYNQPVADTREDDNYRLLLGFDYYIREWLMAGLEYRYWDRDSNLDIYDFTENRFMVTVGVAY